MVSHIRFQLHWFYIHFDIYNVKMFLKACLIDVFYDVNVVENE